MVKEADSLVKAGHKVTVIGQYINSWAMSTDRALLATRSWEFVLVGGSPNKYQTIYFITRLMHKLAKKLSKVSTRVKIMELALGRCSHRLYKKALQYPADIYIGHNMGAIAATAKAAKKKNVQCGFDAEDFHRNEESDDESSIGVKLRIFIENTYLPEFHFITAASPLICEKYEKLFPEKRIQTILNVFPRAANLNIVQAKNVRIRLFWFSQAIGLNRGLAEVLYAMSKFDDKFELHLLGALSFEMEKLLEKTISSLNLRRTLIHTYPPLPPDDLISFSNQFDIGLATELKVPYNREICLTNKIFSYIQAGLAVVATDTEAQKGLMKKHTDIGLLFNIEDNTGLVSVLNRYLENKELLYTHKQKAYALGQSELCWEVEERKLLSYYNVVGDSK
jgi:glycosyltransferase involved in cell wall biosynthesis